MAQARELIFVSYAHRGAGSKYISLCADAFRAANMESVIWTDEEIESGDKWQDKIEDALRDALAAILYVDWEFLSRPYIQTKELPAILARASGVASQDLQQGIPVIPILVESCFYDTALPWLNSLQIEPEHSMRRRVDPRKEKFPDLLTLSDLEPKQLAQFKTELAKRFLKASESFSSRSSTRTRQEPQDEASAERREGGLVRYLQTGEELIGNYVELQVSLAHTRLHCYRVDLRFAYKDRNESGADYWRGQARIPWDADSSGPANKGRYRDHGVGVIRSVLSARKESSSAQTTIEDALAEAIKKARYLSVPLQISIRISSNAGELQEIPWETLDWWEGKDGPEILFSRTLLTSGEEAVECQTRARTALRVLSIYSDAGPPSDDRSNPSLHTDIQASMTRSLGPLSIDGPGSTRLLRPDRETLLYHLAVGAPYDVLYLACEASRRGCEFYFQLAGGELSEAQLRNHLSTAPAPRLVILAPAGLIAGREIDDESTRALLHLATVFSELGAAGVLTCQSPVSAQAWGDFVLAFAKSLSQHGHLAGAMAQARSACDEESDCWKPVMVTRIKTTRMWYEEGFVSQEPTSSSWDAILESLSKQRFCPVIGPGILYRIQQARLEVAREMADEYDFPLSYSHRISLPTVAQFARTLHPNKAVFLRNMEGMIRRRMCSALGVEPSGVKDSLWDLGKQVATDILSKEPSNPYNVLARLPVGLYLNTNLDPLLSVALEMIAEKDASNFDFTALDPTRSDRTGASEFPPSEFLISEPMVVQFNGTYQSLERAVMAEDDYLEQLANFALRMKDAGGTLGGKLGTSDLVFLGFKWNSLEFRVIFRALQKYAELAPEEATHIAVQIDPDDDETIHPEKVLEYLRRYFSGARQLQRARIGLYWGSTEDFLMNLEHRWNDR